jgi:Type I site-specific restriction-modification system, R (restriction) subunit and related helicases
VNKKDLTEADIRTKFITPALVASGWDLMNQLREEAYFTKGRVMVRGKTVARGEANKADYLLFYKPNLPIAVIEAKDTILSPDWMLIGRQEPTPYLKSLRKAVEASSIGTREQGCALLEGL